ncbi:nucleoside hydrolase [Aliiglaciecola sp. 2_MG-2023]|uniref:nucleoside hydrolase n=1 Tax=Alteromonadaceae TaxID=72275 RepID=UPI0026E2B1B7|nr:MULTISPECIES: nucleoside hydrolase [unclassified Aliiglaciecola]MDO6712592.1 nucleoside hydrolase [Aliiglaciecola sp. 2_MG-2023]MDO6753800.1 nucleoside hydrolase [Aliiglaciecola sp. 1_MG-2023]
MAHKIILDTDPGIDDAMAIFFAFQSPDIEVLGLTTVYGNVPVTMSAQNALTLCELADQDIPVTKGVGMPWVGPESGYAHFVHGDDGFGNIDFPSSKRELDPRSSAQYIVDMARQHPGEITLVAIGPLGNLALALRLEPELPNLVKGVVIMGGAAFVKGNVTPVAEANIWNDAHAAEIVFAAPWDLKMFGLDVTNDVPFTLDFLDELEIKNPKLGGFVKKSSQFYVDFYSQDRDDRVCFFHDAMPLAYLVDPSLFEFTRGHARVSTDPLNRGQTTVAPEGSTASPLWLDAQQIDVATKVDHDRLRKLYIDTYSL